MQTIPTNTNNAKYICTEIFYSSMDTRSSSDMATWTCLQCREAKKNKRNMWLNDAWIQLRISRAGTAERVISGPPMGDSLKMVHSVTQQQWTRHLNTLKYIEDMSGMTKNHILICISSLSMATLGQGCDPASRMYQCATLRFTTKLGLDWNWGSWKPDERLPMLGCHQSGK